MNIQSDKTAPSSEHEHPSPSTIRMIVRNRRKSATTQERFNNMMKCPDCAALAEQPLNDEPNAARG